ncbi:MAG TPA: type II secretion system secretin GspD [Acetobacteraceae bacterium]|nr:type II secretion system secretin GspD [Acetobacteraceae bacterium]
MNTEHLPPNRGAAIGHGHSGAARVALVLVCALAACTRQVPPTVTPLPQPLPEGQLSMAPPRINGDVGTRQALQPPMVSYGTPEAAVARPTASGAAVGGDISLDFADTDIRAVVAQILGTILRVNYTIDPAVHGTATLRTQQPLTRSQLLPVLQSLLAENGAALVQAGSLYRVVPTAQAAAIAAAAGTAGVVAVRLRFVAAEDLAKVLQPFVSDGGKIAADPANNALLVNGSPDTRDSLVDLIHSFDVNVLEGQSYALLPVENGGVKDFATALQDAFRGQTGGALAGQLRVVPMTRVNAVLVIASNPREIDQVRRVYGLVERQRRQTIRSWHVYYLQNSPAEDVAYVLQQAFTPNNVTAQPTSQLRRQNGAAGGGLSSFGGGGAGGVLGQSGQSGGFGQGGGLTSGGLLGASGAAGMTSPLAQVPQAAAQAQAAPLPTAAAPLAGPLSGGTTENTEDTLRIIPDPQNNALLVYGTGHENDTIDAMLRKIDILPLQVRIDAVIAEVQLNDNLQYGTQFFFQAGGLNGLLNFASNTSAQTPAQAQLNLNFPGFFIGGHGVGGAPFALNALQQVTTLRVLSSPELLVLDNQPARLQVGNVVPYLSQTSQSTETANAPIVNSINYQQTGVVLDVTPRVNSGGLVTLDISQEVSDVSTTLTTPGINSPTFFDRSISSRVVVQDGQTVGLAGLISDNTSTGNQGIPWLKDVPILGALAGNQNNTRQRTELLMLLTPHVIHDQRDARDLTEDMREQLINAAAVPQQLNHLPSSGSADPNAKVIRKIQQDLGQ